MFLLFEVISHTILRIIHCMPYPLIMSYLTIQIQSFDSNKWKNIMRIIQDLAVFHIKSLSVNYKECLHRHRCYRNYHWYHHHIHYNDQWLHHHFYYNVWLLTPLSRMPLIYGTEANWKHWTSRRVCIHYTTYTIHIGREVHSTILIVLLYVLHLSLLYLCHR